MKEGIYLNLNKNYRFYIDGMWEESKSKEVIKIMSPYKDELVGCPLSDHILQSLQGILLPE